MERRAIAFSSRRVLVSFAVISCCSSMLLAAGFTCPDDVPPFPKPAHLLTTDTDKKGGKLELTCTNQSASGDFVWTYTPPGGNKIVIGRCVYVGGQNSSESIVDPVTGNLKYWIHICVDPTPINPAGDQRAVVDIFDKTTLNTTQRQMTFVTAQNRWVETAARFDTPGPAYLEFNPADNNHDTIPDQGFNYITSNLYGPVPPPGLVAESESNITLASTFQGGANHVSWDLGAMSPTYVPGDSIVLENVAPSSVLFTDPRLSVTTTPAGTRLSVNSPWTPLTGEVLVRLAPMPDTTVGYSIFDGNAASFYQLALNSPQPLDQFNFSNLLNMTDRPGYGSGWGHLLIGSAPGLTGDFDNDNDLDAHDIDLLFDAIPGPVPPALAIYDLNHDGMVDLSVNSPMSDVDHWVHLLKGTVYGDADLNRQVSFDDLLALAQNYGTPSANPSWAEGNFDGDADVDFDDLLTLAQNYGFVGLTALETDRLVVAAGGAFVSDFALARALVPEPIALTPVFILAAAGRRRAR